MKFNQQIFAMAQPANQQIQNLGLQDLQVQPTRDQRRIRIIYVLGRTNNEYRAAANLYQQIYPHDQSPPSHQTFRT